LETSVVRLGLEVDESDSSPEEEPESLRHPVIRIEVRVRAKILGKKDLTVKAFINSSSMLEISILPILKLIDEFSATIADPL